MRRAEQKLLHGGALALDVPERPRFKAPPPPAEFGRVATELAEEMGKSQDDLVRAAGYEHQMMLRRLRAGTGTVQSARRVKQVLKAWGADISKLPPIDEDSEMPASPTDELLGEWQELGVELRKLASEQRFEEIIADLRELAERLTQAYAPKFASGTSDKIPRRKR